MIRLLKLFFLLMLSVLLVTACNKRQPPRTVNKVDLQRYAGTWYEIASFPNRFQKGCRCSKAEYAVKEAHVAVRNSCIKGEDNILSVATAKAFPVKGSGNAKLKVQFFWPFRSDYWILYLAKDYSLAVVGSPDRKYLWILARTKSIKPGQYKRAIVSAEHEGFNTSLLKITYQNCNS